MPSILRKTFAAAVAVGLLFFATANALPENHRSARLEKNVGGILRRCVQGALNGVDVNARIVTPDLDTYTDARTGENIQDKQLPAMIAYVIDASEVPRLIRCARASQINPVPRTGGHHFLAYSSLNNSLVIDISHLNKVTVSTDTKTVNVQAGARLGQLYLALDKYGLTFPGGICPTVGISGYLSSGGFNMQQRALGLAADYVTAATVVTADGRIIKVSPSANADLFWAVRGGGGGTYGIIIEWTLSTMAFPPATMLSLRWTGVTDNDLRYNLARQFFAWGPSTDKNLTSQINVHRDNVEVLGWYYGGNVDQISALVNASGLLTIKAPDAVSIAGNCTVDQARLFGYAAYDCSPTVDRSLINQPEDPFLPIPLPSGNGTYPQFKYRETSAEPGLAISAWPRFKRMSKSFFVQKEKPISNTDLKTITDLIGAQSEASQVWGEWHAWNITSGPNPDNAFAWRAQAASHLEFTVHGSDDAIQQHANKDFLDQVENVLRPALGPASYSGYSDDTMTVSPVLSYFGSNVCRLSKIKSKYDYSNVFQNPGTIPTYVPGC
ncbi:hypothetical protein CF319_g5479 [Tilletia indica]|uniref:FAD-binding PCMH-type domain-containing protein n=1 Tax=Tilletia walkeri TaxID=117179 RepID=A0A8X7N967_9BASI|nr:hypothetical protein CF327_g3811 [Tilletia walkeri]KAE8221101.1 hypothetical protein CF319_g5479 [Tilletia indica]KAE8227998.1 hypothetical protein CF326_g7086 [Tilletia indica]KAE8268817.1 hypothetical protein A4X09_0g3523 [Tilletia walkeri]